MSRLSVCVGAAFLLFSLTASGELTGIRDRNAEATGPGGANVGFTVGVLNGNDGEDGRPADTVTCLPASGSLFPIGDTPVACVGSEGSTGSFVVRVSDSTPPALTVPRDFTVVTTSPSGEAVSFSATAIDLVDGTIAVTCTPPSGSNFALGTTPVTCTASDTRGNTATDSFSITVVTSPPPPGNPDIVAEATGPGGATVVFETSDGEDENGRPGSGNCSPAPGTLFPLGDTLVTCPSGNFTVSVVDTTPPTLDLPADITTQSTTVNYTATATDLVDGEVGVTCTPPSGSTFPLGTTTINCSATDAHDNIANGSFEITVTEEPPPPGSDITAEATGANGAIVTYDPGTDDGGRPITCTPPSGSTFPLGTTTVNCSDGSSFTVTVVDTTPPELSLPADMTVEATSAAGAAVTFTATSFDLVDGSVPVLCTPPSGSTFALGTTTVNCSATDAHDNTSTGSFTVTVVDTTPPDITSVTVSPNTLWPPNNQLVDVTVTATVTDLVDPAPIVRIYAITCDEAISASDTSITGPLTAELRAARDGSGDGRVYTLHIEAIDASGNRSTATVTVTVPHDASGSGTTVPSRRRAVRG